MMKDRGQTQLQSFLGDVSHLRYQQTSSGDERFVLPTPLSAGTQSDEKLGNLMAECSTLESTGCFPYAAGPDANDAA